MNGVKSSGLFGIMVLAAVLAVVLMTGSAFAQASDDGAAGAAAQEGGVTWYAQMQHGLETGMGMFGRGEMGMHRVMTDTVHSGQPMVGPGYGRHGMQRGSGATTGDSDATTATEPTHYGRYHQQHGMGVSD